MTTARRIDPAPVWALTAAIVGSAMSFIDGTAVNVALPILQRDLNASAASVQWVVEGYSLFLSALILIGGSLGDLFGRRRVYAAGIGLFALASIACGLAPTIETLVVARCVQGVGGALALPGSLALIGATYDGEARGRAIGTWSGFSAIMAALGPVLGGWLVQAASWRLVFLINVPLAALVLAILAFRVRESRDREASHHLDVRGAALATAGLGALVYGLIRLQTGAGDAIGVAASVGGACALAAFVAVERRSSHPMMSLDLFRSRTFAVANLYTFVLYATLGGGLYFVPFDLINVQGYSPAQAGAALLPFVAIMFPLSRFSGGIVARTGPRAPLVLGAAFAAAAYVVFAFAGIGHSYWSTFFPGAVLLGIGGAAFVAPLTTTVMGAVSSSHAGIASGINNALSRTAGLVAIAALGIVLAHTFAASIERDVATGPQATAVHAAVENGTAIGAPAVARHASAVAYAAGFRATMLWCAFFAACASLVALLGFSRAANLAPAAPRRDT